MKMSIWMCCLLGASQGRCCLGHHQPGTDLGPTGTEVLISTKSCLGVQKRNNAEILLQSCELVLNINRSQSLVDRVQDLLALESAASSIQARHNDTVQTDQHRVPAEGEAVIHCLTTRGAVTV